MEWVVIIILIFIALGIYSIYRNFTMNKRITKAFEDFYMKEYGEYPTKEMSNKFSLCLIDIQNGASKNSRNRAIESLRLNIEELIATTNYDGDKIETVLGSIMNVCLNKSGGIHWQHAWAAEIVLEKLKKYNPILFDAIMDVGLYS